MFVSMIGLMAVGVMFKRKPIAGSCGGLGDVGIEKSCDCDNPCEKRLLKGKMANNNQNKIEESPISFL